jgi:ethanolamine utilization protein EutQ
MRGAEATSDTNRPGAPANPSRLRESEDVMSKVQHFSAGDMRFETYGGPPGSAEIARLVGPETSTSMGGGVATFDGCSIEWTVLYDELIVVLEGTFRLRIGGADSRTIEAGPGDVIWLPENTPLRYEGDKAKVFYALSPVDWKSRHNL